MPIASCAATVLACCAAMLSALIAWQCSSRSQLLRRPHLCKSVAPGPRPPSCRPGCCCCHYCRSRLPRLPCLVEPSWHDGKQRAGRAAARQGQRLQLRRLRRPRRLWEAGWTWGWGRAWGQGRGSSGSGSRRLLRLQGQRAAAGGWRGAAVGPAGRGRQEGKGWSISTGHMTTVMWRARHGAAGHDGSVG